MFEQFPFSSVKLPKLMALDSFREELGDSLPCTFSEEFQGSSSWVPGWVLSLKTAFGLETKKVMMTIQATISASSSHSLDLFRLYRLSCALAAAHLLCPKGHCVLLIPSLTPYGSGPLAAPLTWTLTVIIASMWLLMVTRPEVASVALEFPYPVSCW